MANVLEVINFILKGIMPIIGLIIFLLCFISIKVTRRGKGPLVILSEKSSRKEYPVKYWENSIGRSKNCDIRIDDPTVSRNHAVLYRRPSGWIISDSGSKCGVLVNGEKIKDRKRLFIDDEISLGKKKFYLQKASDSRDIYSMNQNKNRKPVKAVHLTFLITVFIAIATIQPYILGKEFSFYEIIPNLILVVLSWTFLFISQALLRNVSFEIEALAIFLSSIGIILIGSSDVSETYMQLVCLALGMFSFYFIIWFINNPDNVSKWRVLITFLAIGLFAFNLLFAKEVNGSRNWVNMFGFSFQPSELIKIAFVFVGASTLDELQTTKNLTWFILFSSVCIGFLFVMKDFGTACVFFVGFLIISFMRSGSFRTLILSCSAAAIGAFMILTFKPYVMDRFSVWGHVWENSQGLGFQQARVLTYCASGGLFGVGIGNGYLRYIFAATSDLMFGVICEEMGLFLSIIIALTIAGFAYVSKAETAKSRSTFYAISSCAAAGMLLFQAALHIFGITDTIPMTGVTLPFVSLGGSSMISVWGLLAFIKAADERTYALKR